MRLTGAELGALRFPLMSSNERHQVVFLFIGLVGDTEGGLELVSMRISRVGTLESGKLASFCGAFPVRSWNRDVVPLTDIRESVLAGSGRLIDIEKMKRKLEGSW